MPAGPDTLKAARPVKIIKIIDGDTVLVETSGGLLQSAKRLRIRLWGLDAPETSQPLGSQATKQLQRMVGSRRSAYLEPIALDQYQRTVGILHPGRPRPGQERKAYNYRMVAEGWAYPYMLSGPYQPAYQQAASQARARRKGVWKADPHSKAGEAPNAYRRRQREKAGRRRRLWLWIIFGAAVLLYALWFIKEKLRLEFFG